MDDPALPKDTTGQKPADTPVAPPTDTPPAPPTEELVAPPPAPVEPPVVSPPPPTEPGETATQPQPEAEEQGASLPPVIAPPAPKKSRAKVVGTILALLLLVVSLPVGVILVQRVQEIRERAAIDVPCKECQNKTCVTVASPPYCSSSFNECTTNVDCGGTLATPTPTPGPCVGSGSLCGPNQPCCVPYQCVSGVCKLSTPTPTPTPTVTPRVTTTPTPTPTPSACTPKTTFSGATTPGFDCSQRSSVTISMKIELPAGCPSQTFSWDGTNANCPGTSFAGCAGACGAAPTRKSETISGGQSRTFTLSCSTPSCGSCQVDFSNFSWNAGTPSYGVRGYQTLCATPPPISAQCLNIKVYDTSWNQLTSTQLANLQPGDKVRFAVSGTATSGTIDKARFIVNGVTRPEVTQKKPGTNEFFDEYTIPEGVATFTIDAQLHHTSLGWF